MSSIKNEIKIKLSHLVDITHDEMKRRELLDLTNAPLSRSDPSNIWNILANRIFLKDFYVLSLKIYKKWHEPNSQYASLVKSKLKQTL